MEYFYNLKDKLFKPKFLHKYIIINLAVLILKKIYVTGFGKTRQLRTKIII